MKLPLKLPYGISNFRDLIQQGYYYVDKTPFVELLESYGEKYFFFLRPRRFGKSLFVSMLSYYYDTRYAHLFEELFGKFYIGQNPTPLANQYAILQLRFSGIDTTSKETTYGDFLRNVHLGVQSFLKEYAKEEFEHVSPAILSANSPAGILSNLFAYFKDKEHKIYLIIDEYDHFANELLAFDFDSFKEFVSRNGFVRKFYEVIKDFTFEGTVDRLFVTGVSPITLDSLTSGFNIGTNISTELAFNDMIGFQEPEVLEILESITQRDEAQIQEIMPNLKEWYDGYKFNEDFESHIYNSNMVLYFAKHYQRYQTYPKPILDINIASDYSKLRKLFNLKNPNENYQVLEEIVREKVVIGNLTAQFSFEKDFGRDDFLSLLYYLGYLTIAGSQVGSTLFKVPNYVIEKLFLDYFAHLLQEREQIQWNTEEIRRGMEEMALNGNPKPFMQMIQNILEHLSSRDFRGFDEKYIKLLIISLALQSQAYFIKSEREVSGGYTDIQFLERKPVEVLYQFIFELKYLKKEAAKKLEEVKAQAQDQLRQYISSSEELRRLNNLKAFVLVVIKDKINLFELN